MPTRIQRRRTKGWSAPEGAVYVGRGSKWGNPWRVVRTSTGFRVIGPFGDPWARAVDEDDGRRTAAEAYRQYGPGSLDNLVQDARKELAGRDLACWCPLPEPGQPDHCHAAVLLAWAAGGDA